ncbi:MULTISPECIES: VOC family protein [Nocardia]|uniref:VOC family protein n=1 Tax=Nocardia TaxID=1817 RepID=UPI001894702B|nr:MULTISPECIES: VOC family protein [Nocardia]MBF6349486.1 VOC family protein [Nocardia flavorosea]
MTVHANLAAITIDCASPTVMAEFYREVTGWKITHADEDSAYLGEGSIQLAFQRIADYAGPSWPDTGKHAHLDFTVADVKTETERLRTLGATVPEFQPGQGQWTVLADPEGHLFCLAAA